ncbi:pilus assembly protein PilP [Rhabdochromatium marinum]|uniref:pilus assembly protein PilP n=1 Tax=Rhabdochromatium marinum TaxID=48729 RepID=UPI001905F3A9|nr:pilus assembly protein PilP [Rhabdochromatium marinum]MBK1649145.1 pilus assembly protein PilP [Rhabdochromatium marinum]
MSLSFGARLPYVTALITALGLGGCGDDPGLNELQAFVAEQQQRRPPPLDPVPQIKQIDNFIYDPTGLRNPFIMDELSIEAIAPETSGNGLAPDLLRRKEELEQYSLDSLRMVGTLNQDETMWALIVSPDGVLHRVSVGNYMGRNYGRVTSISEQGIQLTELVNEGVNEWVEQQTSIALKQ